MSAVNIKNFREPCEKNQKLLGNKKEIQETRTQAVVWIILHYIKNNYDVATFDSMFIDQAKVLIINYYILANSLLF